MERAYKLGHGKHLLVILVSATLIAMLYMGQNSGFQLTDPPISANELNIDLSSLPREDHSVNLQEWNNPKIEMLIITHSNFTDELTPLAEWKNKKGVKTIIATNYSAYEGVDTQEKIRNMIRSYYEREDLQWVLIAGDTDIIPIREVYNPDVVLAGEHEDVGGDYYKPTDYYYAELNGTWDQDEDGIYGESSAYNLNGIDEIEWFPEVYVGRLPASNEVEIKNMVDKTLKYETNPTIGAWMESFLLGGVISNYPYETENGIGEDEARLTSYIISNYVGNSMELTHLVETTSSYEPEVDSEAITYSKFVSGINSGNSLAMFAGHGAPDVFVNRGGTKFYKYSDASIASNDYMPTLIYASACDTSTFDSGDNNIGEALIKRKDGGAIGYIGGLRVTWYFEDDENLEMLNRGNCKLFWQEFFLNHSYQQGKALFDSKVAYLNSDWFQKYSNINMTLEWERKNVLSYSLLGDPEVDIYTAQPKTPKSPFTGLIYEGQYFPITITSTTNELLPNARIHLSSENGKYRTFYSNSAGKVYILLPLEADTYDFTISGHNIVPIEGSFNVHEDTTAPSISNNILLEPTAPTVSDNICFSVNASDSGSGIENVFLLLSHDSFTTYEYKVFEQTSSSSVLHTSTLEKLDFMAYDYAIVGFDYAGNSLLLYDSETYCFEINPPVFYYILIIANFSIIGIAVFGSVLFVRSWQTHSEKYKRIDDF